MMHALPPVPPPHVLHVAFPVQADDERRFLTIRARMADVSPDREEILVRALRQAKPMGWEGEPVILSETVDGSYVSFLVEFPSYAGMSMPDQSSEMPPSTSPRAQAPAVPAPVSRPAWVLVVPVEAAGSHMTWGRTAWARAWQVPVRRVGMRLISTVGDDEDKRILPASSLDDMSTPPLSAFSSLSRKYSAPAVALVRDEGTLGVSAWVFRNGHVRSGHADSENDPVAHHEAGLRLVEAMTAPGASDDIIQDTGPVSPLLRITSVRRLSSGLQVTLLCDTTADDELAAMRKMLTVARFSRSSYRKTEDGLVVTTLWPGDSEAEMRDALSSAGVTLVE